MTFKLVDRVRETCISPGTATVALIGAALGYQTFSAGIGANNTTYYVIADQSGANWEVGYGTVGALGTTLARTTVLSSSNGGSLVNFTSGTQDVWVDYPATKAVFQDSTGTVSVPVFLTTSTTSTTPNLTFNASNTPLSAGASISGSYLQAILQNKSGTAGASTNYVLSNDLGTDSTYYGEFGMNSSVFSATTPTDFFSINNGVYFSGHDGDITVGSGNGFKTYLAWGTTGQSAHVINASGALGFSTNLGTTPALSGTTGYGTAGQVPISAGSTGAVVWSSTPTLTGTNFTGVPISTAVSGLGTGIAAALAVNTGLAGAPVLFNGALGTPSSGTLTNCTFPTLNQNTTGQAGSVANSHTAGTGLSGSTFNGSAAVTWTLATAYGDSINPYASKTANYFLAAPNGTAGAPTFRAIVAADIPTLNQNTTGTASNISGTLAVSQGGTGATATTGTGNNVLSNSPTITTPTISLINTGVSNSSIGAGNATLLKNRLIDAGFIINQRTYVSGTALASGSYGHDRWKGGASGGTYTFTQGSVGVPIVITITAGSIQQVIEGANMPDGGSFVLSWTGTAQGRINGGSYSSSPLTVTGLTAGANCTIEFNTGTLSFPQFEVGSSVSGFEYRQIQQEWYLCQRYYAKLSDPTSTTGTLGNGMSEATTTCFFTVPFVMRTAPSINFSSLTLSTGSSTPTVTGAGSIATIMNGVGFELTTGGSLVVGGATRMRITTSTGYIDFSAEL